MIGLLKKFALFILCSLIILLFVFLFKTISNISQEALLYTILLSLTTLLFIFTAFRKLNKQQQLSNQYRNQNLKIEKEARRADFLLDSAEQITGIAHWKWNFATNEHEFSNNLYRLFGYEPGTFDPGMDNFLPLIDEEDRTALLKKLEHDKMVGQVSSANFWATRKDGQRRYFRCTSRFLKNGNDEDIIIGTTQDITETYLLKQERQQYTYLLEQVVEHNIDMIMVLDTQLRITLWNKSYEEAFGIPRRELLGKKLVEVFPYLENDIKVTYLKAALEGKETIRQEFPFFRNQRIGEISIIPLKDNNGIIEGVLTIIHDITESKKSAQHLKESNIRFEQAEEAGNLGSFRWNIQTGDATASKNLYYLYGFEPGSVIPSIDFFIEMIHPDDRPRISETIQKNIKNGEFTPIYCRIIRKDGEVRFVKASGIPVQNEKGETVLFGSIADITEEEQLKQQLQGRSRLLESVIENSHDLISVIGDDMRFTLWNKASEDALGQRKEAVIGKKLLEVFPQLAGSKNMGIIQAGLAGQSSIRKELTDPRLGAVAEMNHIPLRDDKDKVTGLLIVTHDITERKKAAEKLKKANTELHYRNKALQEVYAFNRHITDMAPNAIYVYDIAKGCNVFTNKRCMEVYGFTENEVARIGSNWLEHVLHPHDLPAVLENMKKLQLANDGEVQEIEYRIRNQQGEYRHQFAKEAVFKRNAKGEVEQIIGVAVDVTDLKIAEQELKEKNEELQLANEELSSFNFIASHDLQEPLRKIQTFANFIEETELGLTEKGKSNLKRMQLAAGRMRILISDLLSFSKVNMEQAELELVNLNEVKEQALFSLKAAVDEKGASIIAHKLPVVQGISFQLQQLFENIIGNAVKYCEQEKTPVVYITSKKVSGEQNVADGLQPGRVYYQISFQDNGIGFDQQYADKIFELFQRLHGKHEYPGTGLGLAICKKIVQNHGGHIQAKSKLGEGSAFEIFLPAVEL